MQENNRTEFEYRHGDAEFHAENQSACDETSSASELRECTESTRQRVDHTIRRLEDRISPGQFWNRLWNRFNKRGSGSFDVDRTVGRNPIPFVIIGSGLALIGAGMAAYAFTKMRGSDADQRGLGDDSATERDVVLEESGLYHGAEPIVTPAPPEAETIIAAPVSATRPEGGRESQAEPVVTPSSPETEPIAKPVSTTEPEVGSARKAERIQGIEEAEARTEEIHKEIAKKKNLKMKKTDPDIGLDPLQNDDLGKVELAESPQSGQGEKIAPERKSSIKTF